MACRLLRTGAGRGAQLVLRHSHTSFPGSSPQQSGAYVRSHLRSPRYRDSPSSSFPAAPSSSASRNRFVGWYLGMIDARPILTKSLTACAFFTVADISSQMMTFTLGSLDLRRTLRMAGYGMLVSGPSLHLWFSFMSRILPKRDVLNTLKKMVLGQALYVPGMTAFFFSVNAGLQGETGVEIIARLKRDLLPTLINGIVFWPICDFMTLMFIPVRLQPLSRNSFSFIWIIYVTYMAGLPKASLERISSN